MRRWNRSRISIDCKQNLLSPKHDTSRRFLLVTFLKNRKERTTRTEGRDQVLACCKMGARDCAERKTSFRKIRVN